MQTKEKRKISFSILFPVILVSILWLIKLVEFQFDLSLVSYGILPRSFTGLFGILFSPLIHGDWTHLINNSIPLLILGATLYYFYQPLAFKIFFYSWFLAGLYTWISARGAYHIGASGLVYALFGFLLVSGFIRRSTRLISISFLTAFLYGSLIWGILPWDQTVSWEGHFWGLLVGIVLAFYFRKEGPQRKLYSWDLEEEVEDEESIDWQVTEQNNKDIKVIYHFKPNEDESNGKD